MNDSSLDLARALLKDPSGMPRAIPQSLPETGLGDPAALELLAPHVLSRSANLGSETSLAHMDPPTPEITWATALWNASQNQNLLHPATSPFASEAEALCISWLAPFFGMSGGHFCAGSTIGNLTALWAARNYAGIRKVVASEHAHNSIKKCCDILSLDLELLPADNRMCAVVPRNGLSGCCLILTAGTTGGGAIDPLNSCHDASWVHVDAAWAGPLRLSHTYAGLLDGIEKADSVAVSAHKMLLQPKESAFILFREYDKIMPSISTAGAYLAKPTVGVQGSRSASAISLLAFLLSCGRSGVERILDDLIHNSELLFDFLERSANFETAVRPVTGINVFRSNRIATMDLLGKLPQGMFSSFQYQSDSWLRSVSANPGANLEKIIALLQCVHT